MVTIIMMMFVLEGRGTWVIGLCIRGRQQQQHDDVGDENDSNDDDDDNSNDWSKITLIVMIESLNYLKPAPNIVYIYMKQDTFHQ